MRVQELIDKLREMNPRAVVMIELSDKQGTMSRDMRHVSGTQNGFCVVLRDYIIERREEVITLRDQEYRVIR